MAEKYFKGDAAVVAQVSTAEITAYDVATTYKILIGDETVSVVGQGGTVSTTATALRTALNASTHPYFSAITWSGSTAFIVGTADTAGCPFVATTAESGGTGTIGDFAATTANAGPNDFSTADNWSDGAVPTTGDTLHFANSSVNVCWGLTQSGTTKTLMVIHKSYTGKIGLNYQEFATSADGESTNASYRDYRETHLTIDCSRIDIGYFNGIGTPNGSARINIDTGSVASTIVVHDTATQSAETGRPAVRILANSASTVVNVLAAPGGVGIASDLPGETSTVGTVRIGSAPDSTVVVCSKGVTCTTWEQNGGTNTVNFAATITTITVNGGQLTTLGDYTVTTLAVYSGTVISKHLKTGGDAITTLNIYGGIVDGTQGMEARTWATVNLQAGGDGTLKADGDLVTITTLNEPNQKYSLSFGGE